MSHLLSIENALCRIGRQSILKIDQFQISTGQHWCIYGPNGAGKSLFANLLIGRRLESQNYVQSFANFQPALDVFIVSFEEQQRLWQRDNRLDISEFSDQAQDLGTIVSQLICSGRKEPKPQLYDALMADLDLNPIAEKGIRFLSSGQIRKVLIARALYAGRPGSAKLLVLDEPLESIDRDSQQRIVNCIAKYLGNKCCSIQLCRRHRDMLPGITHIALMENLAILQQGALAEVLASPAFKKLTEIKLEFSNSVPKPLVIEANGDTNKYSLIRLNNITVRYGELTVLTNVCWHMESNHHVLVEGPNGCGKSTLLSLIDGENHKGYGQEVFLFGQKKGSGETVWDVKRKFGIVSNELHNKYIKGWKVLDVVVSGFFDSVGLYDESSSAEWELAKNWLATLGIPELEKHYYHEISFGQQRVVLLARAMVKHPKILILDEPCVGLDDYYRELILGVLDLIAEQTQTKLIYVSHVEDEQPACINQKLTFVSSQAGGFTLEQTNVGY